MFSFKISKPFLFRSLIYSRRYKGSIKKKWASNKIASSPMQLALKHFDDFYKPIYGGQWPSLRLAMLSQQKYCAVVNNFSNVEDVVVTLSCLGAEDMFIVTAAELEKQLQQQQENLKQKKIRNPDAKLNNLQISELDLNFDILSDSKSNQQSEYKMQQTTKEKEESLESEDSANESSTEEALHMKHPSLYDFVPVTKLKGMTDDVSESDYFAYYNPDFDFKIDILPVVDLQYPKHLKVFTFEKGNISLFPAPRSHNTNILGYYLMDAASVLPVLALDIRSNDVVLDLCAAPGGKTLVIIQSLLPDILVCNDVSLTRKKRLEQVLRTYIPEEKLKNVYVMNKDAKDWQEEAGYDKVLVDVPCTTDRHMLFEDENNFFKPLRMRERIHLPELQTEILCSGIRAAKPGGSVVYSTCALCPVQNDGVVQRAIQQLRNNSEIEVIIRDLSPLIKHFQSFFHFYQKSRYGQLVIPHLSANFGPLYFCKIQRVK